MAITVPLAACNSYWDFVRGPLNRERGNTHNSDPVSIRNCTLVLRSVINRRPDVVEAGQTLSATNGCPCRFPYCNCMGEYTSLLYLRTDNGKSNADVLLVGCVDVN